VLSLLAEIQELVASGKALVSDHGFRRLKEDAIQLANTVQGLANGRMVEEYPDYHKGPCVLVLQRDANERPVHVLWGMSKVNRNEAVLITAYRPDPARWSVDFLRRLPK
jgi:hypothetical protein